MESQPSQQQQTQQQQQQSEELKKTEPVCQRAKRFDCREFVLIFIFVFCFFL